MPNGTFTARATFFLILSLLFYSALSHAGNVVVRNGQLNVSGGFYSDSETFYVDSENNLVGIGTSSPEYQLDIESVQSDNKTPALAISRSGHITDYSQFISFRDGPTQDALIGRFQNDNDLIFGFWDGVETTVDEKVRISPEGNVGIGTASPAGTLSVHGGSYSWSDPLLFLNSSDGEAKIILDPGFSVRSYRSTDGPIFTVKDLDDNQRFIVEKNGSVGIGTTSPSKKLHLYDASSGNWIVIQTNGTGVDANLQLESKTGGWVLKTDEDQSQKFNILPSSGIGVVGTSVLTIQQDGNVGIGTTAPGELLDVDGNISTTGNLFLNTNKYLRGTGGGETFNYDDGTSNHTLPQYGLTWFVNNHVKSNGASGHLVGWGGLSFITGGQMGSNDTAMTIRYDGDVGIGTTSPSHALNVVDNDATINVSDDDNGVSVFVRAVESTTDFGQIGTYSDHDLRIITNSTVKLALTSEGNVGIGTTSPQAALDIIGDFRQDGYVTKTVIPGGNGNTNTFAKIAEYQHGPEWATGSHLTIRLRNKYYGVLQDDVYILNALSDFAGSGWLDVGYDDFFLLRSVGGEGEILVRQIEDTGDGKNAYVEIWLDRGGQYPTQYITFEGNFIEGDNYSASSLPILNVEDSFNWTTDPGNLISAKRAIYARATSLGGNVTVGLAPDGGNVGIGTASPQGALNVVGTFYLEHQGSLGGGSQGLTFSDPDDRTETHSIYMDSVNNSLHFATYNGAWGDRVTITKAGKVGIGTVAPGAKLHINTSGSDDSRIYVTAGGTGTAAIYLDASDGDISGADYASFIQKNDLSVQINNYGNNPLHLRTGDADRVTVTGAGYVGIGDTTPSEKLDVAGNVRADDFIEYTEDFVGDALTVLKNAKVREGDGEWLPVEHTSWPGHVIIESIEDGSCENQTMPEHAECVDLGNNTCKVYTRSLSGVSSINTRAIQQLIEENERKDSEIAALKSLVCMDHPDSDYCKVDGGGV